MTTKDAIRAREEAKKPKRVAKKSAKVAEIKEDREVLDG
jgi:hypothetical protein